MKYRTVDPANCWNLKGPLADEWGPSYLYIYIYMNLTWRFFHEHVAPFLNAPERTDHHRIHSTRFCFIGGRKLPSDKKKCGLVHPLARAFPRHRADTFAFAFFPCFPHLKNVWSKCFQTSLWPLKNFPITCFPLYIIRSHDGSFHHCCPLLVFNHTAVRLPGVHG